MKRATCKRRNTEISQSGRNWVHHLSSLLRLGTASVELVVKVICSAATNLRSYFKIILGVDVRPHPLVNRVARVISSYFRLFDLKQKIPTRIEPTTDSPVRIPGMRASNFSLCMRSRTMTCTSLGAPENRGVVVRSGWGI